MHVKHACKHACFYMHVNILKILKFLKFLKKKRPFTSDMEFFLANVPNYKNTINI
jgi:hypothetical protein